MGPQERPLDTSPTRWQPAELQAAFAEFEQTSQHLAESYASLERRVLELTQALNQSHAALENELLEKERLAVRMRALLDALPGGVIVLDGQGQLAQFNPVANELLGPLELGAAWIDIVARAFAPRWDDGHDVSLVDGRRVNVATAALPGEPGQILLIKDVTETRLLQEQLNHHRRLSAKTELAAVLAHQIRTPLATALLQIGNLNRPNLDDAQQQRARHRARESIRQIEHLVDDMLSFARGTVVDPAPIPVARLLYELAEAVAAQDADGRFTLRVQVPVTAVSLLGNRHALMSVLLNLVDNARQAQQGCGACDVTATSEEGTLRIRITDHGPGVPAAQCEQIFEPFFTTRAQGTGLGLAAARAVARAHGGDLMLAPATGAGATFVLTLPLLPESRAVPVAPNAQSKESSV